MIRGNGRDIVGDFPNVPAHLGTVDYDRIYAKLKVFDGWRV